MNNSLLLIVFVSVQITLFSQVSPLRMGSSAQAHSSLFSNQNQVAVDHASNSIVFVHTQNTNLYGGGSEQQTFLRYDLSTDGGTTFNIDLGPVLSTATLSRPQVILRNDGGSEVSDSVTTVFTASRLTQEQNGPFLFNQYHLSSSAGQLSDMTFPYSEFGIISPPFELGSLTSGEENVYWSLGSDFFTNQIKIFRGEYQTTNDSIHWQQNKLFDFMIPPSGPRPANSNIDFYKSGNKYGWLSFLGNIAGGNDQSILPILAYTSNYGSSWSELIEVDLQSVDYDGSLTLELNLQPGEHITCSHESDLVVDAFGNPHLLLIIGKSDTDFEFQPGSMMIVALTTTDNGQNWSLRKIDNIYTWETIHGRIETLSQYNFPQISRSEEGKHIFYSWVDSDTSYIGATTNNLAPNLRASGYRLSDQAVTCVKKISDRDFLWGERIFAPTMSPEVLSDRKPSPTYELPIVVSELVTGDVQEQVNYHYFGNDVHFNEAEFYPSDLVNDNSCSCKPGITYNPLDVSLLYNTHDSISIATMNLEDTEKVFLKAEEGVRIVEGAMDQGALFQILVGDCDN